MIGAVGVAKVTVDLITIVNSLNTNDEMSQVARIMMQDLMTTLLGFIVLLSLFLLFSFLLVFSLLLTILHILLQMVTCFKYSLLAYFKHSFARLWRKVLNRRLAALEKFRIIHKRANEEDPC